MKLTIVDEEYRGRLRHLSGVIRGGGVVSSKLDGFHAGRAALRSSLGLRVEHVAGTLEQLPGLLGGADAVLFVPSWRHDPRAFADALARLPGPGDRPPLAVFDTFDQTSSPFFSALPSIDLYIKSQVLRDRSAYASPIPGGYVFADWMARELGFDLGRWHFGSVIPEGYESRLACGWNMGASRHYRYVSALARRTGPRWRDRPIQLNRRFPIPDPARVEAWEWYQEYRRFAGRRVSELCGEFTQTGHEPLPRPAYAREMRRSRIVFSPFGWGEVCFRDFEAVARGAVLVKPDMGHLETYPDIYEDRATYVAVRWDLADLPDACRWILGHPAEAERIAENARRRLASYLPGGAFVAQVGEFLARLGLRRPEAVAAPTP